MCLATVMRIDKLNGNTAECSASGISANVRIDFIENPEPGDYVMIHAGFAIDKVTGKDAEENALLMEEMRDVLGQQ